MSTEREQLELAAKACGYTPTTNDSDVFVIFEGNEPRDWNPKHDDGDCARMEAQLEIELTWFFDRVDALACDVAIFVEFFKDHAGDKNAARRAASLAVAAEIGRALRAALGEKP